jgi:predicted HAD superfamily Cof-like phosphohydrolase
MSDYLLAALAGPNVTKEQVITLLKEARQELAASDARLAVYADARNWVKLDGAEHAALFAPINHLPADGWHVAATPGLDYYLFDPVRDIAEFHTKFGLTYDGKPRALTGDLLNFRVKFMAEELDEYEHAADELEDRLSSNWPSRDNATAVPRLLAESLDALVDEVYVVLGTSYLHGFNFKEAWRRVHAANMAKVRAERASDSKRGSTFDVVKPPGWTAPDHLDLVADHAHKE